MANAGLSRRVSGSSATDQVWKEPTVARSMAIAIRQVHGNSKLEIAHAPGYSGTGDRFPAGSARARRPMRCRSAGQMKDRVRVLRLLRQCLDGRRSWESE